LNVKKLGEVTLEIKKTVIIFEASNLVQY